MTVKELNKKYSEIHIVEFLNGLLKTEDRLHDEEEIVVMVPSYFEKLPDLLEKTPKRVLANYIFGKILMSSVHQLGSKFTDAHNFYIPTDRWKTCVDELDSKLPVALGAFYLRKNFEDSTKDNVLKMIENIRSAFHNTINKRVSR